MLSFYKEGLFLFFVFNVVSSLSFHAHSYLFQSFFICLLLVVWCLSNLPPNLLWLTQFQLFTSLFIFPFSGNVQDEGRPGRFSSSIESPFLRRFKAIQTVCGVGHFFDWLVDFYLDKQLLLINIDTKFVQIIELFSS